MSVLVVGTVGIDRVETPHGERSDLLGGSASFAGLAASFHAPVSLNSVVGEDFPAHHRAIWEKRKIDLSGLQIAKGKTFRWHGQYEQNMNNRRTISTDLNVLADFQPQLSESQKKLPFVLLGNLTPDLQHSVLDQMQKPKFVVADTMNLWIDIARTRLLELLPRIDLLILNDSEATQLSDESNLVRAARWLRERGPRYVAVKKGEHGCFLSGPEGAFAAPAVPLEQVLDPTGAGDTFAGGLTGYLAGQKETNLSTLAQGVIEGTILASFTVEDFSLNRLASLSEKDIAARRRELLRLINPNP
ncbi:MAG: sugar kinase [Verrucomicrobia bacterium]|jgi:sugar/nucleoside kinase (ribokinase family)|nr:sugar kinase [Verrucomicrobiota bacterium]